MFGESSPARERRGEKEKRRRGEEENELMLIISNVN